MNKSAMRILIIFSLFVTSLNFSQGKKYEGPDDPAGDPAAIREGWMNGNRVWFFFQNTAELSGWPRASHFWPEPAEGNIQSDGIALLIGARVYIKNDSIPVTDPAEISALSSQGLIDTLYYCQTGYREGMDTDPVGTVKWGMYPVSDYMNPDCATPAMSNNEDSWPPWGWPDLNHERKWPGQWNGRFGRGIIYADLETYFVANDAQDQEYLGEHAPVKYYPRPGYTTAYMNPDVSVQKGLPWGGLGIRTEVRGFQWNNPYVRNVVFWEYSVANVSDYDLPEIAFGCWVDVNIGGGNQNDEGSCDPIADLVYFWDGNGTGNGDSGTGSMGFAYLETPGMPWDGIDNDGDGLTDEKRDNEATRFVGPTEGVAEIQKFLEYYGKKREELKSHWDADEDQDWQDGQDANGNGLYDITEDPGDDVGLDGVGPGELQYIGPDWGECNHRPDYKEGIGCEPNFASTDVDESDMLGLTSFNGFDQSPSCPYRFSNDRAIWDLLGKGTFHNPPNLINPVIVFATGSFALYRGRQERLSMAELHATDPLDGLNGSDHSAPRLYELKRVVQDVYEMDYRFARPPIMPTLKAKIEEDRVVLSWDYIADTRTREPLLGGVNDFEGFKLYRATDPSFTTGVETIADASGDPIGIKPIFQCDSIDGISGYADYGLINGTGFYLGNETGITHQFTDSTVQKWKQYYYALVAYDYGIRTMDIRPCENNFVIEMDHLGQIRSYGKNVAMVNFGFSDNILNFGLRQNYPNPFNTGTTLSFSVGSRRLIRIILYNAIGQKVRVLLNEYKPSGCYEIPFQADGLSSGIYIIEMYAGQFHQIKKMLYMK